MSFNADKVYTYNKGDELFTPKNAITPIVKYLPKDAVVWECAEKANGDGNITIELRNSGIEVISTSIHEGVDFLNCEIPDKTTHIITNPPFSLKNNFLERCYKIGKPFALLLPVQALDTKKRFDLYKKYGLELLVFDKRISYIGSNGSPPFSSCWFCNGILPEKIMFEQLV